MDNLSKNARLELVLQILENYNKEEGLTTSEVAQIVKNTICVSQRTTLRDLTELSLQYPIYETQIDGKTYWKLDINRPLKEQLNLRRLQLLEELLKFLKSKTKTHFEEAIDNA